VFKLPSQTKKNEFISCKYQKMFGGILIFEKSNADYLQISLFSKLKNE